MTSTSWAYSKREIAFSCEERYFWSFRFFLISPLVLIVYEKTDQIEKN